jgi:Ca2+-transporting ATPase
MMTHVFENKEGKRIIAKGGPETIIKYPTSVRNSNKFKIQLALASKGYRILGVGYSNYTETNYPQKTRLILSFRGLGGVL